MGNASPGVRERHLDAEVEVSSDTVDFIDKEQPRHAVLIRLSPDCLGLRLNSGNTVEQRDCTIQNSQAPLDFDGEVDMTLEYR
jgi:hypothetical protein